MPTTIPTITALPSPSPQTSDPDNFQTRGDALLVALPTMVTEENAAIAAMNTVAGEVTASATAAAASNVAAAASATTAVAAAGYLRRAANSLTIGTGAKNLTGLNSPSVASFANGDQVSLIDATDDRNRMWGAVSLAVMASGTMTVTVAGTDFAGSGTLTNWIVVLKSLERLAASTAAQVRAGTSSASAVSPAALVSAAAFQTLTDAATVNWDAALGFNARVTLAGNRTMAAPTNLFDGLTYSLFITQDATGTRTLTWNSIFDWGAPGAPALSTGVGKVDQVFGIYSSTTGKIHASFRRAA